jgi:hypothetical protein
VSIQYICSEASVDVLLEYIQERTTLFFDLGVGTRAVSCKDCARRLVDISNSIIPKPTIITDVISFAVSFVST